MNSPAPRVFDISARAIAKLLAAALLVFLVIRLSDFLSLLCVAILLAITFELIVQKLEARGVKRGYGMGLIFVAVLGIAGAVSFFLVPSLAEQIQGFGKNLPKLMQDVRGHLPPSLAAQVEEVARKPETMVDNLPGRLLELGSTALGAVSSVMVAIIFAFYFLFDGRRTVDWVVSFFTPPTQRRLRETGEEITRIVGAYVIGQLITSVATGLFTGFLLWWLKVPAALMLAVFAAVLDIVPVVGITIAIASAVLTALSVSPAVALWVAVGYFGYQCFENYVLSPKIYGRSMEVSNLVVLLSLTVGALLGGAVGVILGLPIAAAYPVIERIWLRKYLGDEVVERHRQIAEEDE